MYRAVAIAAREAGIEPDDAQRRSAHRRRCSAAMKIKFDGERIHAQRPRCDCRRYASPRSASWRRASRPLARCARGCASCSARRAQSGGVVMEGRDIGTAVFPDAEFKFFLDADVEVRAAPPICRMAAQRRVDRRATKCSHSCIERDQRDSGARAGAVEARGRRDSDRRQPDLSIEAGRKRDEERSSSAVATALRELETERTRL